MQACTEASVQSIFKQTLYGRKYVVIITINNIAL